MTFYDYETWSKSFQWELTKSIKQKRTICSNTTMIHLCTLFFSFTKELICSSFALARSLCFKLTTQWPLFWKVLLTFQMVTYKIRSTFKICNGLCLWATVIEWLMNIIVIYQLSLEIYTLIQYVSNNNKAKRQKTHLVT